MNLFLVMRLTGTVLAEKQNHFCKLEENAFRTNHSCCSPHSRVVRFHLCGGVRQARSNTEA